jgi:hypothetical protein
MISHSIVVTGVLLFGACSKSDPDTLTKTYGPVAAAPAGAVIIAAGASSQAQTTAARPADDHDAVYAGHLPGMLSGMPMRSQHPHDGGVPQPCPDCPIPVNVQTTSTETVNAN